MATFDARRIITAGGEPFNDIMAAVAALSLSHPGRRQNGEVR